MKRLLPLLILLLAPPISGAAGYFGARAFSPAPPPAAKDAAPPAPVAVPTGKVVVQIYHPARIVTLVTDASVTVPADEATALSAPLGHARLLDRAYQVMFDAAETPLYRRTKIPAEEVAHTLAAGLGSVATGMTGVSVHYAVTTSAARK